MKKLIPFLFFCLLLCTLPFSASAASPIDPQKEGSITLQYRHNGMYFEGLSIKSYRIAEVFPDGTYSLCGEFKDYPVNIYGITSQAEWNRIASTLSAYVAADEIAPTRRGTTDEAGTVEFSGLLPGMYLTTEVRTEENGAITTFHDFLTVLPHPQEDGNHSYNIMAYPKCESYTPSPNEIEYKVVKQWQDTGHTEKRPKTVQVDILKDGVIAHTQTLSAENNWCFRWAVEDDGSKWTAVERNIPKEYTVSVTQNGSTIIITNALENDSIPPHTGDTTVLWPYILAMILSGLGLILLAIWGKRAKR